ncbi:unnamed protein product [Ceratitis capitata]|uniref:(Mediterranean fruit fly) hypothetical protein n=1 Tax=Ceratitis capitata TaxID=7213 RepID=A0A811UQ41_CERCA|nr:unnamed protein product [Ceratitis capitata]
MDQSKASCSKNIKELRKVLKETLNIDLKLKRSHHIDDIASEAATIPPTKITPKTYKEQFNADVGQNVCCQLNKELVNINANAEVGTVQSFDTRHQQALNFTAELSRAVKKLVKECALPPSLHTIPCETSNAKQETYPKLVNCYPPYVVIGPNGTRILEKDFNKIDWKTCKGATRKLIGFIFSREAILDTDFAQYLLDPDRLADMEHCLLAKTNGTLYQIQKAFAEKFIDIHMKFYRRHYK